MQSSEHSGLEPLEEQKVARCELARIAKALGHPARIAIVQMLLARSTCFGCDIADRVGLAASTTSEHLRILKNAGLIDGEIAHPRVCYALAPGAVLPLLRFLELVNSVRSTLPANDEATGKKSKESKNEYV